MKEETKTQAQLKDELAFLRRRIIDLELLEYEHSRQAMVALQESEKRIRRIAENATQLEAEIIRRQHVEQELEAERRRLFSVLDGLPAQVYLIAPDHSFRFSNHFFQERFGNPGANPCYSVFHGRGEACPQCTTFKPGQPIDCQQGEWSYPEGDTFMVYDYPFIDIDGVELLLSFGFDITQRKQIEAEWRLSEERFTKAFNASPIPMTISTLQEGRFIDVNDSFCQMLQSTRADILGRTSLEVGFWLHSPDRLRIKQMIVNREAVREMEVYFGRRTGEQGLALITVERIDISGEACLLSIVSDITERKKMEIEIIRLDRLGLVGEMAASIGHEIRNPMTTVRGYLQILREKKDYAGEQEVFDLMIEELDRANSIITDFLSLAKNKLVELKPLNLKTLLTNIILLVQANAVIHDQNIELDLQEVPDLLLDEKEIRQLAINLIHNALEAMPAGKNVIIRTFVDCGQVVLAVQDQGSGIERDLLEKVGTPFFTTKECGTGLGLAVCYGIAARHQAKIDIETSPGGTTFWVRFPINQLAVANG